MPWISHLDGIIAHGLQQLRRQGCPLHRGRRGRPAYAEAFARGLHEEFTVGVTAANLRATLDDLGRRLALGIVRAEVIALRRLLIGEARSFPALGAEYFDRAPGQVLDALASGFEHLARRGLLRVPDARRAAAQFAYLVAGEPLDRAMLVGTIPSREHVIECARDGVQTFLARYGAGMAGLRVPNGRRKD